MTRELFTKRELTATRTPARRGRPRRKGSASVRGLRFRWYCGDCRDHVLCRTWQGLKRRLAPFSQWALANNMPGHAVTFEVCDAHGNRIRPASNEDYRAFVAAIRKGK